MIFKSLLRTCAAATLFLLVFSELFAAQPTVTVTKISQNDFYEAYSVTFTTTLAAADSAFITKSATANWDISHIAGNDVNSRTAIAMHLQTTETTVDSQRTTALFQTSWADSPGASDWRTLQTTAMDSTINVWTSFTPVTTAPPRWLRVIVYEDDTNKDAAQTYTLRLIIPRKQGRGLF